MANTIKTLKDQNNNSFVPITSDEGVICKDGSTIREKHIEFTNELRRLDTTKAEKTHKHEITDLIEPIIIKEVISSEFSFENNMYYVDIVHNINREVDVQCYGADKEERFIATTVTNNNAIRVYTDIRENLTIYIRTV